MNGAFTESWRRLELVAHEFAPAGGVDVGGQVVDPLVKLILPAVEVDEQQAAHAALHRGHTHQARLHQVHRFQLHVGGEAVARVVLKRLTNSRLKCCFCIKYRVLTKQNAKTEIANVAQGLDFLSYGVKQSRRCSLSFGLLQVFVPGEGLRVIACQDRDASTDLH